jgi:uncharacterized protein (DUF885 family)
VAIGIAATLLGCGEGSWAGEKQDLEDRLSAAEARSEQLEKRVVQLLAELEKEKEIRDDAANLGKLARNAHEKTRELISTALRYPTEGSLELRQSSGTLLIMSNDAAKEACDKLDKAIEAYK